MIKELIKLANELDSKGLTKEANTLDDIIKRVIVKESLDASGLGGYGAASRPAPRWPGDPGDAAVKQQSKDLDKLQEQSSEIADWMQVGLDVLGLVPGLGEPFDAANAAISIIRGRPLNAVLSMISVIPVYGDIIGKGSKLLLHAAKTGLKTAKWGAKVHTLASLGSFVKLNIDKVDETAIAKALGEIDRQTNQPKGTMYAVYVKEVKEPINQIASGATV